MSTDNDAADLPDAAETTAATTNESSEQWDDEKLASKTTRKTAVANASSTELLDMKALDLKGNDQDDIAEKLRIEETKAKLAAAKEGMEREAQKLKEEQEKKEQGASTVAPRFGAAAAGLAANGGKWVPPHLRGAGGAAPRGLGMGPQSQKLDTQNEELFPDLAAAEEMLQQKKEKPAYSVPKKTPVGGGATWGSKSKKAEEPKPEPAQEEPAMEEPPKEEPTTEEAKPESAPAATASAAETKAPIKPIKKKKKKDISTFKTGS